MEKFLDNLIEADRIIKKTDHMIYVSYSLVKDKKILLKVLIETKKAIVKCINYILQYEYLYKRIRLSKDPKENLRTFKVKCAKRYDININEIKLISELFQIIDLHKNSPMEFKKKEAIVILSEESKPKKITLEDIKEFVELSKNILKKIKKAREIWF